MTIDGKTIDTSKLEGTNLYAYTGKFGISVDYKETRLTADKERAICAAQDDFILEVTVKVRRIHKRIERVEVDQEIRSLE